MEKETWKDIPGFEGLYQASSLGEIKSVSRTRWNGRGYYITKEKILKSAFAGSKSKDVTRKKLMVILIKDGKRYNKLVHQLVALAYIGERPENMVVCHCDGNHTNNKPSNLRYDTQQQNVMDIYRHNGHFSKNKLTTDEVLQVRKMYSAGKTVDYIVSKFHVQKRAIERILDGTTYKWLDNDGTVR